MLKKNNNSRLRSKYDEKFIYFIQLWGELLDGRTSDIYQYKILNTFLSLKELNFVLDNTMNGLYNSRHNLDDCKEETLLLLQEDDIIKKIDLHLYNSLLDRLGNPLKEKSSQIALKAQLGIVIRKLETTYLTEVFDTLKNDLLSGNNDSINKHTNMLVSQCLNNGWSTKALHETIRFLTNEASFECQWNKFQNILYNIVDIVHHVYIEVSIQTTSAEKKNLALEEFEKLGFEIYNSEKIKSKYANIDLGTNINKEKNYLFIDANKPDVYSSALYGLREISDGINLLSFYNLINAWNVGTVSIFVINPVTKYSKVFPAETLYKPNEYLDITGKIFESTKEIFSELPDSNIAEKLSGAFAYTNISRTSFFQEAKFINLWVALESLVRTDLFSDIITNLKEIIPAALCKRYLFRVIRNFIEDCERCGVELIFIDGTVVDVKKKQEAVITMLKIFKDSVIFDELKIKANDNNLLLQRIKDIHLLVNDQEVLKRKIKNHYIKIKWQLQRLYRIRNEIAHSAKQKNLSTIHIEHLFEYLSMIILEIVATTKSSDVKNIEEIFCKFIDNYSCMIKLFETKNNNIITDCILETGIANFV